MIKKLLKYHCKIISWISTEKKKRFHTGIYIGERFLFCSNVRGIQHNVFGALGINGKRGELFHTRANLHDYSAKIRAQKCVQFFKEDDNGGALFNATPQKDPSRLAF